MPITIELQENGRVVYGVFVHPYTLNEAVAALKQDQEFREQTGGIIHGIIDVSRSGKPPHGLLKVAKDSPSLVHPTRGKIAVIGASFLSQTIIQMASKLARRRYENIHFFNTADEAWTFIRKVIADEKVSAVPA